MLQSEKEVMAALLGTEAGRLFCGLLMRETGVFAPSAMSSAEATYLREGERNVGVRVFTAVLGAGGDPIGCMREFAAWFKQCEKVKAEQQEKQQEEQANG